MAVKTENDAEMKDVDQITARVNALRGLAGKRLKPQKESQERLEIAVPRRGYPNQVEYYEASHARQKFKNVDISRFTKVIRGEDGVRRPLPQAYEAIQVDPTLSLEKQKEARDKVWREKQETLDFKAEPGNGRRKNKWKPLDRSDPDAWYEAPGGAGLRVRKNLWHNAAKAGENLPELTITQPSTNKRGFREIGMWRNDPAVKDGLDGLVKQYGADKVEIKDTNNCSSSVAALNQSGEHEAERLFARITGNDICYNRELPPSVVQHEDYLVSMEDIRNEKLWSEVPLLKDLSNKIDRINRGESVKDLAIGFANRSADQIHNPKLLKKLDEKLSPDERLFSKICQASGLNEEQLARMGKSFEGGPVWVQIEKGVLRDAESIKKELGITGKQLREQVKSTQIFVSNRDGDKNIGSLKSFYAIERDTLPICEAAAKTLDVSPRQGRGNLIKDERARAREAAIKNYDGDSSDDESPKVKKEANVSENAQRPSLDVRDRNRSSEVHEPS